MAITDHDTIEGLEEGKNAAEKAGIIFVPGIEITIDRPSCEFHLLGLGIENPSKSLLELIQKAQQNRKDRNQKIVDNLNGIGLNVTLEEIQEAFPGQTLCRPHFASWMEEHKVVKHRQEAFDKYLARGKPWFSEHKGQNMDDAIRNMLLKYYVQNAECLVRISEIISELSDASSKSLKSFPESRMSHQNL